MKPKQRKKPRNRRWTRDEIGVLKKLFRSRPVKDIAKQLKRSQSAVANKAAKLGLRRVRKRR